MEVERAFLAEPNAPMLARQQVGRILRDAVPAERLDDLRLATSELVTSAVINGRITGQEVISISVGLDEELDVVRVTVEQPIRPHPSKALRSRQPGLFTSADVLDAVTDRWGTAPGPPALAWFEIDLDPPSV